MRLWYVRQQRHVPVLNGKPRFKMLGKVSGHVMAAAKLLFMFSPLKVVARGPHSLATAYFSNLTTTLLQDCSSLRGGSCVFLPPCLCLSWEVSACLPALHLPGRFKSEPALLPARRALSPLLCFHRPVNPAQDLYSDILPQVVHSYLSQASVNVLSVKTISLHLCIP